MEETMSQVDALQADAEGAALMQKVASNPRLAQAAIEIAQEGDAAAARYADDPEVTEFLQQLQRITEKNQKRS